MTDFRDIFRSHESQNWCKAWTAVQCLRDGLKGFVYDEIEKFQQSILPAGLTCNICITANVIPCPTRNVCQIKRANCNFHTGVNCQPVHCAFHKALCAGISKEHRFNCPSWKNSIARNWESNPWEVAKCYMAETGYYFKSSVDATDLNGIMSVVINCKWFQNSVSEDLSKTSNLFAEVRQKVNAIRHMESMKPAMTDTELTDHIDAFTTLLNDAASLQVRPDATSARARLQQLKTESIVLTSSDAELVLREFKETMESLQDSHRSRLEETEENMKQELQKILADALKQCVDKGSEQASLLQQTGDEVVEKIAKEGASKLQAVQTPSLHGISPISTVGCMGQIDDKELEYKIEVFKMDLVDFYQERHGTIPLSPLFSDADASIKDFYVMQKMFKLQVALSGAGGSSDMSKPITDKTELNTYADVFMDDNDKLFRNIYIQGEPGSGKTTLSKKLAMDWCAFVKKRKKEKSLMAFPQNNDDLLAHSTYTESIEHFDCVFLILLRDARNIECDIEKMIKTQILTDLAHSGVRYDESLIPVILTTKRCLVILDGLDEWVHPDSCERPPSIWHIPHRKTRKMCTIMTTTRPWRMAEVRIKDSEIDNLVELDGISDVEGLIANALHNLNIQFNKMKTKDAFLNIMEQKLLEHFLTLPIITMHLLCLWFEDKPFGQSRCQVYNNMIDLMLHVHRDKQGSNDSDSEEIMTLEKQGDKMVPVFSDSSQLYQTTIESLAGLAYYTLFCGEKQSSITFHDRVVQKFLTKQTLKVALKCGLLTKNKSRASLTDRRTTYCFIHKTFQEYLAVLHIAQDETKSDKVIGIVSLGTLDELADIFVFSCGLCPGVTESISSAFMKLISEYNLDDDNHLKSKWLYRKTIMKLADIFVFSCGLCPGVTESISSAFMKLISEYNLDDDNHLKSKWLYRKTIMKLQSLIVKGYREGSANGHLSDRLALHGAVFDNYSKEEHEEICELLVKENNRKFIHSLSIASTSSCVVNVLRQGGMHLKYLALEDKLPDELLDLSEYTDLQYLTLGFLRVTFGNDFGPIRMNVKVPTANLTVCSLVFLSEELIETILNDLSKAGSKLEIFEIRNCIIPYQSGLLLPGICENIRNLTLSSVEVEGDLNLSGCKHLKTLISSEVMTTDFKINTSQLEFCSLDTGSETRVILESLAKDSKQLTSLFIRGMSTELVAVLCSSLKFMTSLQTLDITRVFRDQGFETLHVNLPDSLRTVKLIETKLPAQVLAGLADKILQFDHCVNLEIKNSRKNNFPLTFHLMAKKEFTKVETLNDGTLVKYKSTGSGDDDVKCITITHDPYAYT